MTFAKRNFFFFCAAGLLYLLCNAQSSFAMGSVIAGGGAAAPGGTTSIPASGVIVPYAQLEANKSYACTALAQSPTDVIRIDTNVIDSAGVIDNTANGVAFRGDVAPQVTGNVNSPATIADDRVVITPVAANYYGFYVYNTSSSGAANVRFECMETTLYGGYNTNANPFNFLELTNTTNATIAGRVRGFNYDGTATVDTTFSIAANNRYDVDVHSAAGANKYGILIVTHNGPYGALNGAVSQYSGSVGSLTLRATVPLKPRDQTF